jgi:hypothetical protein
LYEDIREEKISPIIPQDIIFTLPFSKLKDQTEYLKNQYFEKSYKSLDEYLNSNKRGEEEILMVYTFSKIEDSINLTKK